MSRERFVLGVAVLLGTVLAAGIRGEVPGHNPNLDDRCPEGQQWSRLTVACEQANCPPGASRTYTLECNCGEAWNKPFRTCYENGLATHCIPKGERCEDHPSGFDPVTGGCESGWAPDAEGVCRPVGGVPELAEQSGANAPPQVAVTLRDPVAITVGKEIRFLAQVSDDRDRPDQMGYVWTLTHVASGRSRRVPNRKRSVRWTPRREGGYRLDLEVTDRDGGTGTDSLDFAVGEARITDFSVVGKVARKHKTVRYWQSGFSAVRRGYWLRLRIEIENYDRDVHDYELWVIGLDRQGGSRVETRTRLAKGAANRSSWTRGRSGGRGGLYWLDVSVPGAAPVGLYDLELVIKREADDSVVERKRLTRELVVLFNPYDDAEVTDPSLGGKSLEQAESTFLTHLFTWGRGESNGYSRSKYDVSPHDPATLRYSLGVVHNLTLAQRSDAAEVAKALTERVSRSLIGGWQKLDCLGVPETVRRQVMAVASEMSRLAAAEAACTAAGGEWVNTYESYRRYIERETPGFSFPPGEQMPWFWRSGKQIFEQVEAHGVAYWSQCFVFGMSMTAALRAVGIPTRMIAVEGSVHDKAAPFAIGDVFRDRHGAVFEYEPWNFHVWNEVWLPAVNPQEGWALVDATSQGRFDKAADSIVAVPGRHQARAAGPLPAEVAYSDSADEVFVHAETNLPWDDIKIDCLKCNDPNTEPHCDETHPDYCETSGVRLLRLGPSREPSARHGWVYGGRGRYSDTIDSYQLVRTSRLLRDPFTSPGLAGGFLAAILGPTPALAQTGGDVSLQLTVPDRTPVSRALNAAVRIERLPSQDAVELVVYVERFPSWVSAGAGNASDALPHNVHGETLSISPLGGAWTGEIRIPATALGEAGRYRLTVGLDGVPGALAREDFEVEGLPITLVAPTEAAVGEWFDVRAEVGNPLEQPVDEVRAGWVVPPAWTLDGPPQSEITALEPGRPLTLAGRMRSNETGSFDLQVEVASGVGASRASATVLILDEASLTIDSSPAWGRPGETVDVAAEIINSWDRPVSNLEATLSGVDSAMIVGPAQWTRDSLEPSEGWTVSWRVRAAGKGSFELPVSVNAQEMPTQRDRVLVTSSDSEPEEPGAIEPVPPQADADASGDASLATEEIPSVFASYPAPAGGDAPAPTQEQPTVGAAGGGGAALPRRPGATGIWIALAALLIGSLALAAGIFVVQSRTAAPRSTSEVRFDVTLPDGRAAAWTWSGKVATIGRSPDCRLVLEDPEVSAEHAELRMAAGQLVIRDLGSANGVFVNGERVADRRLRSGDSLRLGATRIVVRYRAQSA